MLTATLICIAIAFAVGVFSSASEKLFLAAVFIGIPAFGFSLKYIKGVKIPFHTPDGTNHVDRLKDLFFQIPEDYRLGFFLIAPAFICARVLTTSYMKARKNKFLTPDQVRAKKRKILKSYTS